MRARFVGLLGHQLVVDERVQQIATLRTLHHELSSIEVPRSEARRLRARDRRDMTVPIGTPTTVLISAYKVRRAPARNTITFAKSGPAVVGDGA